MKYFQFFIALLLTCSLQAQTSSPLYNEAYGDKKSTPVIFLHGGPGYNSFSFEASTAGRLADEGYYVIVYDQRGSGRSADVSGNYTFQEAFDDIDTLIKQYNISQPILLGHSWGGTVAIKYAAQYPKKVKTLILTGSPVSYQQTFKAIINNCRERYTATSNPQLKYLELLAKMDTTDLQYANYCFMHAMSAGLYKADEPAANSMMIAHKMKSHKDAPYIMNMTQEPVKGYYEKEHYTTLDLRPEIKTLKVPVYGIYGMQDGLFNKPLLGEIDTLFGEDHFIAVPNASHSVFIDQQDIFINKFKTYTGK